jgi:hypothetical protein
VAGLKGSSGSADGFGTNARFHNPMSVAVDTSANVFISDLNGLRLMNSSGVMVDDIAKRRLSQCCGQSGFVRTISTFVDFITGLAVASNGNVFALEQYYVSTYNIAG